jgi:hypothetical protein
MGSHDRCEHQGRSLWNRRSSSAYEGSKKRGISSTFPQWLDTRWDRAAPSIPRPSNAVRALSEGLRQEVKPYNIRTTVISPGTVATELPDKITDSAVAERVRGLYEKVAISADSFASLVVFAMSQPDDVYVNEILFRPTKQEY